MSVTLSVPVRDPPALGVNVTLIVQFAPAASEEVQLVVSPKSPRAEILVMLRIALPEFASVTALAALVVPTN